MTSPIPPTPPPVPPLRREVEPPRPPIGPWMPMSLLGTATMLTIATAFGVMTRMPRDVPTTPAPAEPAKPAPRLSKAVVDAGVATVLPDLTACLRDFTVRTDRRAVTVSTAVLFHRDGSVKDVTRPFSRASVDRALRACLTKPLGAMKLPRMAYDSGFHLELSFGRGTTDVSTRVIARP